MSWERRVEGVLHHALAETEAFSTDQARKAARELDWPQDMSGRLHAVTDGGRLAVSYEGAEDWEEGTPNRPPRPAARRTEAQVRRADRVFTTAIERSLSEHL